MPRSRGVPKALGYRRERTPRHTEASLQLWPSLRTHPFFRVDTGLAPRTHFWSLCSFRVKLATLHIVQNHGTNTNPFQTCSTNSIPAAKPPLPDHASCLSALGTSFEKAAPIPPSMKASLSVCLPGNPLGAWFCINYSMTPISTGLQAPSRPNPHRRNQAGPQTKLGSVRPWIYSKGNQLPDL